ncbi:MopE-related protein [Nanoarchaeota archaeon]
MRYLMKTFNILLFAITSIIIISCTANVTFESIPSGAKVYCDEGIEGRWQFCVESTPETVSLIPGEQNFIFVLDGYDNYSVNNFNVETGNSDLSIIFECEDKDEDGYSNVECGGDDCNDTLSFINPGEEDLPCNGADDNCNGEIDETNIDADGDNYYFCDDCNDNDASSYPTVDKDLDGSPCEEDCNDNDRNIHPNAYELCGDGYVDNNCDGIIDDNCENLCDGIFARCETGYRPDPERCHINHWGNPVYEDIYDVSCPAGCEAINFNVPGEPKIGRAGCTYPMVKSSRVVLSDLGRIIVPERLKDVNIDISCFKIAPGYFHINTSRCPSLQLQPGEDYRVLFNITDESFLNYPRFFLSNEYGELEECPWHKCKWIVPYDGKKVAFKIPYAQYSSTITGAVLPHNYPIDILNDSKNYNNVANKDASIKVDSDCDLGCPFEGNLFGLFDCMAWTSNNKGWKHCKGNAVWAWKSCDYPWGLTEVMLEECDEDEVCSTPKPGGKAECKNSELGGCGDNGMEWGVECKGSWGANSGCDCKLTTGNIFCFGNKCCKGPDDPNCGDACGDGVCGGEGDCDCVCENDPSAKLCTYTDENDETQTCCYYPDEEACVGDEGCISQPEECGAYMYACVNGCCTSDAVMIGNDADGCRCCGNREVGYWDLIFSTDCDASDLSVCTGIEWDAGQEGICGNEWYGNQGGDCYRCTEWPP